MISQKHAVYTHTNNVVGNLNVMYAIADIDRDIHLVKLGTMGEYGQPNIDIEEGWIEIEHKGRKDRMIYPKKPGSFYHCTKVHDSTNLEFGCRIWGLRATDLNQGVVYGAETEQTKLDPRLATRFDYDAVFGTVLNRFVIQAILGHPLTVYGNGSQTRGYINIVDTVECIRLAAENPADRGEFRVFNQMTETFSLNELAETIRDAFPGEVTIEHIENPRVEIYDHYYKVVHTALEGLGLKPTLLSETLIDHLFDVVEQLPGPRRPRRDAADREVGRDDQRAAADRSGPRADVSPTAAAALAGRRVLVTGGSGFIGRHVVADAARRRRRGPVVDLQAPSRPRRSRSCSGDIAEPEVLAAALAGGVDSVVHLAAVTSVLRSIEQPELTYRTNVARHHNAARGGAQGRA